MTDGDLEQLAGWIRRLAAVGDEEIEIAPVMAGRILGDRGIVVDREQRGLGYLERNDRGEYTIRVRPHLDLNFTIAHELGHWALREIARWHGSRPEEERAANRLAAAIIASPCALSRVHRDHGERYDQIADAFSLSQTAIVLRLAEVLGDERAVVTRRGHVLLRSGGAYPWADVPVVDVARGAAKWRGLARARLRGGIDHGRVALRATDI